MTGQLLAFALASLVVIVAPSPDLMLVLRNTARAGRKGAAWTAAGILLGLGILGAAAAIGITALFSASQSLYTIVRLAGGIYLIYLGLQCRIAFEGTSVLASGCEISRHRAHGIPSLRGQWFSHSSRTCGTN